MKRKTTKEIIKETFLHQLSVMPLSKVTVKGIVEETEINRNTFYYYYPDIYAILEELLQESLDKIIAEYDETKSWEESFHLAISFVVENPKAIYHIYYSVSRDKLEKYILSVAENVLNRFLKVIKPELKAKEEDRKLLAHFYSCALAQIVLTWIAGGMKEDPDQMIDRIGFLMDGSIEEALSRSEKENLKEHPELEKKEGN